MNAPAQQQTPDYAGYREAKARWIAEHPNATPEQYDRAIAELAERYGV